MVTAVKRLQLVESALQQIGYLEDTNVAILVRDRAAQLRADVIEIVEDSWNALIEVNPDEKLVSLHETVERVGPIDIADAVEAQTTLGVLEDRINTFYHNFDKVILTPRFEVATDGATAAISVSSDDIMVSGRNPDHSPTMLFADLHHIIDYLNTRLPPSITAHLSRILVPAVIQRLISTWLIASVPSSLEALPQFQEILGLALTFEEYLQSIGWTDRGELQDWVQRAPRVWLTKRKETSLDSVRRVLGKGHWAMKTVERTETQMVRKDEMIGANGADDAWNQNWDSDEEDKTQKLAPVKKSVEDEDVSGWGFDEDEGTAENPIAVDDDEDDAGAAWGWGDDENENGEAKAGKPELPQKSPKRPRRTDTHEDLKHSKQSAREESVTLKESYTVTAMPDAILEIVRRVLDDTMALTSEE